MFRLCLDLVTKSRLPKSGPCVWPRQRAWGPPRGVRTARLLVHIIADYATLAGETPLFGGPFAPPESSLTAILPREAKTRYVFPHQAKGPERTHGRDYDRDFWPSR